MSPILINLTWALLGALWLMSVHVFRPNLAYHQLIWCQWPLLLEQRPEYELKLEQIFELVSKSGVSKRHYSQKRSVITYIMAIWNHENRSKFYAHFLGNIEPCLRLKQKEFLSSHVCWPILLKTLHSPGVNVKSVNKFMPNT